MLSKICGVCGAKRKWKENRQVKRPTRNQLGSEEIAKLIALVGHHCATKSQHQRERMARAGKLWTAEDFDTIKLEKFGVDMLV